MCVVRILLPIRSRKDGHTGHFFNWPRPALILLSPLNASNLAQIETVRKQISALKDGDSTLFNET